MVSLTRQELYDLVWSKAMTKVAKQFGLSDVALHKTCRKHDVPTPPQGYWAKKEHGKPVTMTPLPAGSTGMIIIHERAGTDSNPAVSLALGRVHEALQAFPEPSENAEVDALLGGTLARLAKAKPGKDGLIRLTGENIISVAVALESAERAAALLTRLIAAVRRAGVLLVAGANGVQFAVEGEQVSFALRELADRVEHLPTEKEQRAVAKWEAEQDAQFKRYGYRSEWGRPSISKWEERLQGRLSIELEEVRDRSIHEYGGPVPRHKFGDTKVRDVTKAIPQMVSAIVAIAVIKRENAVADAVRGRAREEAEQRRRLAERRAAIEKEREKGFAELLTVKARQDESATLLAALDGWLAGAPAPPRVARLRAWCEARLAGWTAATAPDQLEAWLVQSKLFGESEDASAG